MKRRMLWTVAGVALIAVVATVARAELGRRYGWSGCGWHRMGPMSYVTRELKLSDSQVAQIRILSEQERPRIAALAKDLMSGLHQLQDSTTAGNFDQERVQAIATAEGDAVAKLLVEREQFKFRVYNKVLNEQQRKTTDRLQERLIDRLDHVVSHLQSSSN